MDEAALVKKLENLERRKAQLESQILGTRGIESSVSRSSDRKFRFSGGRARQAREKRSQKAMLHTINSTIKRTRAQLNQLRAQA